MWTERLSPAKCCISGIFRWISLASNRHPSNGHDSWKASSWLQAARCKLLQSSKSGVCLFSRQAKNPGPRSHLARISKRDSSKIAAPGCHPCSLYPAVVKPIRSGLWATAVERPRLYGASRKSSKKGETRVPEFTYLPCGTARCKNGEKIT